MPLTLSDPTSDLIQHYDFPIVQKKTWRDSLPIDMLLSAVSALVVVQSSSEIPEGLMNNPVFRGSVTPKSCTSVTFIPGFIKPGINVTSFLRFRLANTGIILSKSSP